MLLLLFALRLPPSARPAPASLREVLLQLDIPGGVTIIGSLILYLLALQHGGITLSWGYSQPVGLLVGWILLAITFALIEWFQGDRALVAPRYLCSRGIQTCCAFSFCKSRPSGAKKCYA